MKSKRKRSVRPVSKPPKDRELSPGEISTLLKSLGLDGIDPHEGPPAPFSGNVNLRYLLAKRKIEKLKLTTYLTSEEVANLKHEYLDETYVHHVIEKHTVGYANGRLAFIYLKGVVPPSHIKAAERGLEKMRWYSTESSNRQALKKSKGHELQFGWIDSFGKVRQFVPTIRQKEQFKETWPLINWMDGIFARVAPRVWSSQLLNQRRTNFRRTATGVSTISTVTMLKNAPTSIHQDSKNAEAGLTVLVTAGKYTGGEFLFPQYGVSIPIAPGDVLIAATHREWHCNFKKVQGLRYAIIGYFRAGLV
jgi:hypothetical protein